MSTVDLLAIFPHPDDAELTCGGTLLKSVRQGYRVGIVDLSLGEMLGQLAIELKDRALAERPVMQGGPVEPERGFILHRSDTPFEATLAVGPEIKLTSSPDILAAIGNGHGPDPALVALGYAGWGRGQLEAELSSNTWLTVPANPAIIFETPFEQRWTAALGLPGVDIRRITQYAGHA